jgi:quercetin dioxygenase-like cupin family protein
MNILRAADGTTTDRTGSPIFEGSVFFRPLPESDDFASAVVSFAPGARTVMHRHTSDQLLYIVAGTGKVADAEGEHIVTVGDTVLIPANTDHWHGAADTGSPMSHITVQRSDSQTTLTR